MTATQRIYSEQSKQATRRAAQKAGLSYDVVDMTDETVYGPMLHHVRFSQAVAAEELSDYRVIVLGIREGHLTPGIRAALQGSNVPRKASDTDLCRLLGTMLALNGAVEGENSHGERRPASLPRSIAFASTIARSKWFTDTINSNVALKTRVTRALGGRGRRADLESRHLDGNSTAGKRNEERRWLNDAPNKSQARMICNVKVFSEGVDVPALDAVAFLDPKQSQIDIVQAVGRVMRKAAGKRFGYIVVPVFVPDGEGDIATLLEQHGDDYRHVGSVLRALQSHDERLAESPAKFIEVLDTGDARPDQRERPPPGRRKADEVRERDDPSDLSESRPTEDIFTFHAVEPGIFAKVVASSGLGRPGQVTADDIVRSVRLAAKRIEDDAALLGSLRQALDLAGVKEREVSTTAALLLCNACLLHRRLQRESPAFERLPDLTKIGRSQTPAEGLAEAWNEILAKDYAPVFRPALSIIEHAPSFDSLKAPARILAECAVNIADTVAELGYDHAGPLYHKILGSAESDGAFYTNNISALMLAGLALKPDLVDWADWKQATGLRILDPACGTGTLLMAALKTVKDRMAAAKPTTAARARRIHKKLVEKSIRGLDINYQATQLATSNLTLGAPTVDYEAMHIHTMRHGLQPNDSVALGSLELLPEAVANVANRKQLDLIGHVKHAAVSSSSVAKVPDIRNIDVLLMNPPFTNKGKRNTKYARDVADRVRQREAQIKASVLDADPEAAAVIESNSISTYFTPLAEALIAKGRGTLAKVVPTTAFASTSGRQERRFLASRFHIDFVVTSHDPRRPNFSENTDIHESLLICRRSEKPSRPTTFIALNRMPGSPGEVAEWLDAVLEGKPSELYRLYEWPRERIASGDWTPGLYYDGRFAADNDEIETCPALSPASALVVTPVVDPGPVAGAVVNPLQNESDEMDGGYAVVWRHQADQRRTMRGPIEFSVRAKPGRERYVERNILPKSSRLIVTLAVSTSTIRTTAQIVPQRCFGSAWTALLPNSRIRQPMETMQAWCAWLNSTPGVLSYLHRRARKLTYGRYRPAQIHSLPLPDPGEVDVAPLVSAYGRLRSKDFEPWPRMNQCPVRAELDRAAADVLGVDPALLADWRERIVREPTISNKPAAS